MGPFINGSRIQFGTILRRSLLNDLRQTSVVAIEVEGASNEFSRVPGLYDHILDLLCRFRKLALTSTFIDLNEVIIIPFLFFGPGTFYAKDIFWPIGIQCRNPGILLTTISPGNTMRGHILIKKNNILGLNQKSGRPLSFTKVWKIKNKLSSKFTRYPWISTGFPNRLVERVGFRIESIKALNDRKERVVIEIVTNGSVSPRNALKESIVSLTKRLLRIDARMPCKTTKLKKQKVKNSFRHRQLKNKSISYYGYFDAKFIHFREPLRLNLGILNLGRERYCELQSIGFITIGQIMERLKKEPYILSPLVKKQTQQSFFQRGFIIG
jgi:DNA-directed RNA polymerase alpha subunit